jgi:endoribonuclease L-PSP, putative
MPPFRITAFFLFPLAAALAAGPTVVVPKNAAKPVGPYSPGLLAGDFLYVSGQGVRGADGAMPDGIEAQTRQCMENVKAILEAAGLTMNHVVYTQVYVDRIENLPAVDKVYRSYFQEPLPARATIGVDRMPTDTTVEINAIAVRDPSRRRAFGKAEHAPAPAAMAVGSRLFVSGIYGRNRAEVEKQLASVLKEAGWSSAGALLVNRYFVDGAEGNVPVKALPANSSYGLTGVWTKATPRKAANCRADGNTVFCEVTTGAGPDIEGQVATIFEQIGAGLQAFGMSFQNIAASNVYLDNLDDFQRMNSKYGGFFTAAPPTRTTVQPAPRSSSGRKAPLVRISVIGVK